MPTANAITTNGEATMQINTRFGVQEIDPASVIQFPEGLAGFEELREFKLFHEEGKPTVFFLQSLEEPAVQFAVINPAAYQVSYECLLSEAEAALLEIDDPNQVAVLVTLAMREGADNGIHANFMGPILLNTVKRIGMQKHLNTVSGSVVIRAE